MERKIINTNKAPLPIGAYNQGIVTNGFIFTAGQVPIDPATGNLIKGNFETKTDDTKEIKVKKEPIKVIELKESEVRNIRCRKILSSSSI